MRSLRSRVATVIGIAAALSISLGALGVASAFALPTTLCKSAQEACLAGNRYGPTKIETSTTQVVFTNTISNIECKKSAFITETEVESGEPLPAKIPTAPTYETCATAQNNCTVTSVNVPYKAQIEWKKLNEADLTLKSGGSGVPAVEVTCGLQIVCRFKAETVYKFKGGKPANISVTSFKLTPEGMTCPTTVELTATYTVNSPAAVYPAHT
jgi:hypothetical protein